MLVFVQGNGFLMELRYSLVFRHMIKLFLFGKQIISLIRLENMCVNFAKLLSNVLAVLNLSNFCLSNPITNVTVLFLLWQ